MIPLIKFYDNFNFTDNCMSALACEYWRTVFKKSDLDCSLCIDDIELVWVSKKLKNDLGKCLQESEIEIQEETGGLISKMQCEKYGEYSFIVAGQLTGSTVAWNIDGSIDWQFTGTSEDLTELQEHLAEQSDVVRVKREGNKFTLLLCKKLCGVSIEPTEGYNPNNKQVIRIVQTCNYVACCCSEYYQIEIKFPNAIGCFWLVIKDKKTGEYLYTTRGFNVSNLEPKGTTLVKFRDSNPIINMGLMNQLSVVRLPISVKRNGRDVEDNVRIKANGDPERVSVRITHRWKFKTQELTSEQHDDILFVLKHKELYIYDLPMFYQGGYNESNEQLGKSTASGSLTQLGENVNTESCNTTCNSMETVNVNYNAYLNDTELTLSSCKSDLIYKLGNENIIEQGCYTLSIRNYENFDVSVDILVDGGVLDSFVGKAKNKCKFKININRCRIFGIETKKIC